MDTAFIKKAPFGRDGLKALMKQKEKISGVIMPPDSPNPANPVKECALENDLPLFQSRLLKSSEAISWAAISFKDNSFKFFDARTQTSTENPERAFSTAEDSFTVPPETVRSASGSSSPWEVKKCRPRNSWQIWD